MTSLSRRTRPSCARPNIGQRRTKGHRQVDGSQRTGDGHPVDAKSLKRSSHALSALKDERVAAAQVSAANTQVRRGQPHGLPGRSAGGLCGQYVSYAQGYMLMAAAARQYGWKLNSGGIAPNDRGGCIIRSAFLGKIKESSTPTPNCKICLLRACSTGGAEGAGRLAAHWHAQWSLACAHQQSPAHSASSMAITTSGCRPIC